MVMKKNILFLCTHNSARSQMAEGLLRELYGESFQAFSAGVEPTKVDPDAIRAMAEMGIDISHQRSKSLDELRGLEFDLVVTVCDNARETCPYFPGARKMVHRGFDDPAAYEGEERMQAFRRVRDEMKHWLEEVVTDLNKISQSN